jgi:predicted transposase/invertase (TIGR01784 family)
VDPKNGKDFLEFYLPNTIKKRCDLRTVKLEPGSYVEQNLHQHFSDILYSVKIAGRDAYIYALIEHLTTPDKLTCFKLLRYQLAIMKQHLDQGHDTLPVVIPLLFYRGDTSPYPFSIAIFDCFEDKELAQEVFLKPFPLIDITVIPDEELRTHRGIAILELVQKNIRKRDALEFIKDIAWQWAKKLLTHEQFQSLLYYISQEGESKNFKAFYTTLANALPTYREDIMTLAQQLKHEGLQQGWKEGREEGRVEGRAEGRFEVAKNLLAAGLSCELIRKVTQLPDLDLAELEKI